MARLAVQHFRPARIAAAMVFATSTLACGEVDTLDATDPTLDVAAFPPSMSFEGSAVIELKASRPAEIYYAFDGRDPVGTESKQYLAPLEIAHTTLVTFVAIAADGRWSQPKSELYAPRITLRAPAPLRRALETNREHYFFTAQPGHPEAIETVFELRSIGLETVRVTDAYIDAHPASSGFYEPGVFSLPVEFEPFDLAPGERREIRVRYEPTLTLRGGALVIVSNDEKHTGGVIQVELWGRVINW